MTRTFGAQPWLLGFDQIEKLAERAAKAGAEGYPPVNIEQTAPSAFCITLAVAGFGQSDLSVTLEDRHLIVQGRQPESRDQQVFLHRGIASRAFQRSFVLAEGIEVGAASLVNGLLSIDLARQTPEPVIRNIPISRI